MAIQYEKYTIERQRVIGFTCNKCEQGFTDLFDIQERFEWRSVGGYSSVWGDNNEVEVVLCQHCAKELLEPYANYPDGNVTFNE